MEEFWEFRYTVPRPAGDVLVKLTAAEAERLLLERVRDESVDRNEALWELGRFFCQCRKHDKAMECLRQIIERLPDPERKAACVLAMGQTMEQARDYDAAIGYYREALALEPIQTPTWYFIQNNLGYCLVTRGKPEEAEIYCRKAIESPERPKEPGPGSPRPGPRSRSNAVLRHCHAGGRRGRAILPPPHPTARAASRTAGRVCR